MPRQLAVSKEFNFSRGLITEASGLNFPENGCTETYNCVFNETGPVSKRPPIDFEPNYSTTDVDRSNKALSTYVWKAVSDEGDFTIVVVQIGSTLYFYNTAAVSLSRGFVSASQVDLSSYFTSTGQDVQECSYANGLGYLFVFHPGMDPVYVSYNSSSNSFSASAITLKIRDFKGVADILAVDERPSTQTTAHQYNTYNQGWATTSVTKADTVTFTNSSSSIGWPDHKLAVGNLVYFTTTDTLPTNFSASTPYYVVSVVDTDTITVSSYSAGTAIVAGSAGAGTQTGYTYIPYEQWTSTRSDYPSNADVWWDFKDENGVFDLAYVNSYSRGSAQAPRGHYILDLFNQDRDAVSGLTGLTDVTYTERPSIGEFFSGRLWYTGIPNNSLNNKIYYSQIIEDISQVGYCYQKYDPTSEDLSILLPTDGGEITISEIGTIYHMKVMGNYLVLFASNGIWGIAGSQGLGFDPTDYSITRIRDIGSLSSSSFVDINIATVWWNSDGIYTIQLTKDGLDVKSLTDDTVKAFYQQIPTLSKKQARGTFNSRTGIITWLYRSDVASDVTSIYEYDRILKLNTKTLAFYPWTLSSSTIPMIHSVVAPDVIGQSTNVAFDVIDSSSDTVVDNSSNQVVAFNYGKFATNIITTKYLTSYVNGGTYSFTWSSENPYNSESNNNFLDWYKYDSTGIDYTSYFISGYRLRGDGIRNFQSNYLYLFSDTEENLPTYDVSARWDYSTSEDTGRWPTKHRIAFTENNYKFQRRRLKIRGYGLTVQFKCTSLTGEPMNVTGWSVFETSNPGI